jgi:hypothetical protein
MTTNTGAQVRMAGGEKRDQEKGDFTMKHTLTMTGAVWILGSLLLAIAIVGAGCGLGPATTASVSANAQPTPNIQMAPAPEVDQATMPINDLTATIGQMQVGDSGYTEPWAVTVTRSHKMWIDDSYNLNLQPEGTCDLLVTRTTAGFVVVDTDPDFTWDTDSISLDGYSKVISFTRESQ